MNNILMDFNANNDKTNQKCNDGNYCCDLAKGRKLVDEQDSLL